MGHLTKRAILNKIFQAPFGFEDGGGSDPPPPGLRGGSLPPPQGFPYVPAVGVPKEPRCRSAPCPDPGRIAVSTCGAAFLGRHSDWVRSSGVPPRVVHRFLFGSQPEMTVSKRKRPHNKHQKAIFEGVPFPLVHVIEAMAGIQRSGLFGP